MSASTRLPASIALIGLVFASAAYLPSVGRGFLKDDFVWVTEAARVVEQPLAAFVPDAAGTFYRPMVSLSFAGNFALYGLSPRGYGLTNLLLAIACAVSLFALGRALGLGAPGAATGALAWLMNPHGINMAVLWISGRTSLLMALFGCLSVVAFLHRYRLAGAVLMGCALLSKEDALALPLLVIVSRSLVQRAGWRDLSMDGAWMFPPLAVYGWLRVSSGALTPATAPSYYQLSSDPWVLAANTLSYLDRGATVAVILGLVAIAVYRTRPVLGDTDRRLLFMAFVWFAAGLAITVRVPVRSSLYAVFPSIGAALALAVVIDSLRRGHDNTPGDRAFPVALALLLLLVPVYWVRNNRWLEPARVSSQLMSRLSEDLGELSPGDVVALEDSPERFANFRDAFGTLATEAARLQTGHALEARIVERDGPTLPDERVRYRVDEGRVERR